MSFLEAGEIAKALMPEPNDPTPAEAIADNLRQAVEIADRARRHRRSDLDYSIDALAKGLKVFLALEGTNFEPITIKRIQQRTGFPYDFCLRALRTLAVAGFATQNEKGWQVGPKLLRFSERFTDLCVATVMAKSSGDSELGGGQKA
jgi:hypothetical protein